MSSTESGASTVMGPGEPLEVLFDELAELAGQRNAIDGRIVEIVAEVDREGLWGATGARSVAALVAWKVGASPWSFRRHGVSIGGGGTIAVAGVRGVVRVAPSRWATLVAG